MLDGRDVYLIRDISLRSIEKLGHHQIKLLTSFYLTALLRSAHYHCLVLLLDLKIEANAGVREVPD